MRVGLAVVVCGLVGLAGCSAGTFNGLNQTQVSGTSAGARLTGSVHGGQQPIVGAHVYLFAASATGYGGAGIAASSGNASVSLLTSGGNTALDSSGGATNGDYYVTTDSSGGFSITGDYTCSAGAQVYLYALGGNPGAGANSAAGLMAVLGNCPVEGNFAAATPFVMVNEVSTIAAAYVMAGFATDATHVGSSGTALALTGIANAFANAGNLADLPTGAALATTPAGNGTVPQTEINTLANVLAACVNSNGPGSTACSTLLSNAMSGGSSGAVAGDTATVAINMAHNPGANIAALYALASGTPPFAPALSAKPNDFTICLNFVGAGDANAAGIAVDGSGNVWMVGFSTYSVTEISHLGVFLSGSFGYHVGRDPNGPVAVAIDRSGNAWVTDNNSSSVTEVSSSGVFLSPVGGYATGGLYYPGGVAIDGSGNAWVTNSYDSVSELSNTGSSLAGVYGYSGGGLNGPSAVAVDGGGNVWVTNSFGNSVTKLSSLGTFLSGAGGYTGGGLNSPSAIAIDSGGSAWIANNGNVIKLSTAGSVLSGSNGYSSSGITTTSGGMVNLTGIAIDGAGNAWVANTHGNSVVEFSNSGGALFSGGSIFPISSGPLGIAVDGSGNVWTKNIHGAVQELLGAAAPVITPIVAGLPATPTADGSSKLGTRP